MQSLKHSKLKSNFLIALGLSLSIVACKKNDIQIVDPTENGDLPKVEIERAAIKINSESDFNIFTGLTQTESSEFVADLKATNGFTSFTEVAKISVSSRQIGSCTLPDDIVEANLSFLNLLNSDGVIIIDDHTFRLDYCNSKIYVISNADAADPAKYAEFLTATQTNGYIGAFPLDVDVLDAVSLGYRTMPTNPDPTIHDELFRGWNLLGLRGHEKMFWNNTKPGTKEDFRLDKRMDGLISYDKFGLFFHLYGKEKYQKPNFLGVWLTTSEGDRDWFVTYDLVCQPRKRDLITQTRIRLNPGFGTNSGENKLDKTFYQGTRRVNYAYVRWDVTQPVAREVEVYRGQTQGGQSFIFYNSQPALGVMNNYIGLYTTPPQVSKPFTFVWQ
jgi:hypothetical protein